MGNDRSFGILGLIGGVALLFVLRRFFPSLSTLLLTVGGVAALLVVILVAVVMFFAFRKPKKKEGEQAAADLAAVLSKGRSTLVEVRQQGMRVRDQQIRGLTDEVCKACDKILRALKERPDRTHKARQFFNYYLPTLKSILTKYSLLESSGVPAADVTENTKACLQDIKKAMDKQYAGLFEADILDLSVEMEVLNQMCRRDGLLMDEELRLSEEESRAEEESQGITLTM